MTSTTPTGRIAAACLLVVLIGGCRAHGDARPDSQIVQHARAARTAYAEGADAEAIEEYRLALRRAWQIDDPIEIAHNAYNLAACLSAAGLYEAARDALAEARAELARVGKSDVDAWLLEAKIARSQGLLDEAAAITESVAYLLPVDRHAAAARREVARTAGCCPPPGEFETRHRRLEQLPGKLKQLGHQGHHAQKRVAQRQTVASVHLVRANLACDDVDLASATEELQRAERRLRHVDDPGSQAELNQVWARVLLLSGQPLAAAARLDAEAALLRQAEHYRELPPAYSSAGEAYQAGGDWGAAADRFHRVARVLYARGEWYSSLHFLERSVTLAVAIGDFDAQARSALLLNEVERAVQEEQRREARNRRPDRVPAEHVPSPSPEMPPAQAHAPQGETDPLIEFFPAHLPRPLPVIACGRLVRMPTGHDTHAFALPGGPSGFDESTAPTPAEASHDRRSAPSPQPATEGTAGEQDSALEALRAQLDRRVPLPLPLESPPVQR